MCPQANFPRNSKADAKLRLHMSQQEAKERGEKTDAWIFMVFTGQKESVELL